jgi:hypothetical protein
MGPVRGFILIMLGLAALVRGFTLHGRPNTGLAFGLGAAALALGVWHLTRKPAARR